MQPSVLRHGNTWRMWYSTYGRKPRVTGLATSRDGIRWEKYHENPVLPLGAPGEWDDYSAFQPCVVEQDGWFHMLYNCSCKTNPTGYRIGDTWSEDGIVWTKSPQNPIIQPGPRGSWDADKVSCPTLLRVGRNAFHLYYSGARNPTATYEGIGLICARLEKNSTTPHEPTHRLCKKPSGRSAPYTCARPERVELKMSQRLSAVRYGCVCEDCSRVWTVRLNTNRR